MKQISFKILKTVLRFKKTPNYPEIFKKNKSILIEPEYFFYQNWLLNIKILQLIHINHI